MKTRTLIALACALFAMGSTQVSLADGDLELIYSGPVEAVNVPSGELSVLGHQVATHQPVAIGVGSLVNVYGRILPNGAIASAVVERVSDYATGSDSIYLKGRVTAISVQVGRFSIGDTQVDYAALLSDSSFQLPALGETIAVVGIQPTTRGVVLAAEVYSATRSAGVIQTGSAAGVIQTGNKLGVIQTGSAAGVIQTGSAAGVIQTGNKLGVIQTGSAAGVIQTGSSFGSLH
jgi:TPP-dependent trihydroxycyclohexane-1,2-dione (THcHDO) dehydratase